MPSARSGARPADAEYNKLVDGIHIGPRVGSCGSAAYNVNGYLRRTSPPIRTGPISSSSAASLESEPAVRPQYFRVTECCWEL